MKWNNKDLKLKQILYQHYDPDKEKQSVANAKVELIQHLKATTCWNGLSDQTIKRMQSAKTFHTFDQALDQIYDYADENRIWLGDNLISL